MASTKYKVRVRVVDVHIYDPVIYLGREYWGLTPEEVLDQLPINFMTRLLPDGRGFPPASAVLPRNQ